MCCMRKTCGIEIFLYYLRNKSGVEATFLKLTLIRVVFNVLLLHTHSLLYCSWISNILTYTNYITISNILGKKPLLKISHKRQQGTNAGEEWNITHFKGMIVSRSSINGQHANQRGLQWRVTPTVYAPRSRIDEYFVGA